MNAGSILLLLLAAAMLVMMFTRARNQQRETAAVQAQLAPGVEVMTGSGLFATVVEVTDDEVVLETEPGHHSRWDKRAVARIVTPPTSSPSEEEDTATQNDPTHET